MKNVFVALAFLLTSNVFATEINNPLINYSTVNQNYYAVTGHTRNQYGQNYSINLRIKGISGSYSSSIVSVEYNDGYDWIKIPYYSAIGASSGTYYVSVNYQQFYFRF